jgi:hypothetical protein
MTCARVDCGQRYEEAKQVLERALAIEESHLGRITQRARSPWNCSDVAAETGQFSPASDRARHGDSKIQSRRTPDLAETLNLYGEQLWFEGDLAARESYLAR